MSGNFDYPPANTSSSLGEASHIVRDARSHRTALRHRLDEVRRLRDDINDSDERQRLGMQQSAVRDEIRRRHAATQLTQPTVPLGDNVQAPTSAVRSRMDNVRHRVRNRLPGRVPPTGAGRIQQAMDRLNEASSNLSSLLDQPIPRIGSPDMSTREYSGEAEVNRRRKRRKLSPGDSATGHMNGHHYGYRGQVVSGPLRMEIVRCDGGVHSEAARNGREYWPENVLRNDKSVYCTDDSRCNIIMRHLGETLFALKKIIIKAPEKGFTAPIQEGMVFISMTQHDLLPRTYQYQLRETSSPRRDDDADFEDLYGNTDENRPLSRRRDSTTRTVPPPISNSIPRTTRHNPNAQNTTTTANDPFPLIDLGDDSTPPPRTTSGPDICQDFDVTTTCSDPSSDEEEPSSAATLADLYHRDRLPPAYSSDEDDPDGLERAMRTAGRINERPNRHRRSRRRAEPSKIEVVQQPSTADAGEVDANSPTKDVLAPHAKFFIEREKSVVSIKFDPPVSGKFVLLKLWSPARDQNIDIQSIICHGFSGPRFFPATRLM